LMNFEDISSISDPDSFEYFEYQYDLKNRLKAVKKYLIVDDAFVINTSSYLYDIDGFRIEKKGHDGSTMRYVFDRDGKVLEYIDLDKNEVTNSVYLKSRHLAQVTSEETLFYGTDHQGTTVLVTNADGEKIWTSEATPFGDAVVRKTGERDDLSLKYTGKDLDEDTGLYYARWYDAGTGRFISEDSARDGANWYSYVYNNPLKFTDPTGMFAILDDIAIGIAVTVGVVVTNHTYKMATDPEYREATQGLAKELGEAFGELAETLSEAIEDGIDAIKLNGRSNPLEGEPGSENETRDKDGNIKQKRTYGEDGYPEKDIDHDHGHGSPHQHKWTRNPDGSPPTHENRQEGEPVDEGDKEEGDSSGEDDLGDE